MVTSAHVAAARAANTRWLEDCVVHLLCVLALDRFGDYGSDQVGADTQWSPRATDPIHVTVPGTQHRFFRTHTPTCHAMGVSRRWGFLLAQCITLS